MANSQSQLDGAYDYIVVGAGASGSVYASILAQAVLDSGRVLISLRSPVSVVASQDRMI